MVTSITIRPGNEYCGPRKQILQLFGRAKWVSWMYLYCIWYCCLCLCLHGLFGLCLRALLSLVIFAVGLLFLCLFVCCCFNLRGILCLYYTFYFLYLMALEFVLITCFVYRGNAYMYFIYVRFVCLYFVFDHTMCSYVYWTHVLYLHNFPLENLPCVVFRLIYDYSIQPISKG